MGKRTSAVTAYIAKARPFARPILVHLRDVVHESCPDVEEKLKWGFPFFEYKGLLCAMAAFKEHATFGFWKHSLVMRGVRGASVPEGNAMGSFGRLESLRDLPSRATIARLVRKAAKLNQAGIAKPKPSPAKRAAALRTPAWLTAALRRNRAAHATYTGLTPGHRREYVEWLKEAKTEPTRAKRLATAIAWLAEGKKRNWKYARS